MINVIDHTEGEMTTYITVNEVRLSLRASRGEHYYSVIDQLADALNSGKSTKKFEAFLDIEILSDDDLEAYKFFNALVDGDMTKGQSKAYRMWVWRNDNNFNTSEYVMNDFCWEDEIADFIDTLRRAGIKSFILTNSSTALMENIHGLINGGCKMEGICEVEKQEGRKTRMVQGIRFKL